MGVLGPPLNQAVCQALGHSKERKTEITFWRRHNKQVSQQNKIVSEHFQLEMTAVKMGGEGVVVAGRLQDDIIKGLEAGVVREGFSGEVTI